MEMYNPPHPGALVAEALATLNISMRDLARALDVAPSTLQRLITGQITISPEMAIRLSVVIGSSAEMWLRLQNSWSLWQAGKNLDTGRLTPLVEARPDERAR